MAKRKRKSRRGTGSVLQVRQLSGLGKLTQPNSVMGAVLPIAIGGVVTGGTIIGIRSFMTPDSPTKANVMEYAPWVGLAAGSVAGLLMWNMTSQSAGLAAIAAAGVLTISMVAGEAVAKSRMQTAGLGAIVPQYDTRANGNGRRGTGAILMERAGTGDASRGANIKLTGLGKINTSAFGTPGFSVS